MNFTLTDSERQALRALQKQRLNEADQTPVPVLYGCSTTGVEWRFLKLVGQEILIDETRYALADLPPVLGRLQQVIDAAGAAT